MKLWFLRAAAVKWVRKLQLPRSHFREHLY